MEKITFSIRKSKIQTFLTDWEKKTGKKY